MFIDFSITNFDLLTLLYEFFLNPLLMTPIALWADFDIFGPIGLFLQNVRVSREIMGNILRVRRHSFSRIVSLGATPPFY